MAARRFLAGILSMLLPGVGQLYLGARRRGLVLLALAGGFLLVVLALAAWWSFASVDRRLVGVLVTLNVVLLALRLFAVLDASRGAWAVGLVALAALTAVPHLAAGYVTVRGYRTLETVFADEEPACGTACDRGTVLLSHAVVPLPQWVPKDAWELALVERLGPGEVAPLEADRRVLAGRKTAAARPWTTILLLGTDEGPGNWGARTDTIIVAAVQHGTGRAVAFGVPRNLVQVPLGPGRKPFREPLNALYGARGGGAPGATALKQAVSSLLGLRVDYYALANLRGFAGLVDALGGVTIHVKERLHDSVTRAAWGEPKPRIDVHPGRTYRFDGHQALAYVRSRKNSNDYTRMARQRCFLSALADQADPLDVLRNFGSIARTVERNVRTDIPLDRLPRLVRLATRVDPRTTLTVTFGPEYISSRRKSDNYPRPSVRRIRATAREALLDPQDATADGTASRADATC
jgi:LCP family protein required for cell wall assembly